MASANTSEDGSMYADKETDSEIWSLKAQLMTNLPILMNLPWGENDMGKFDNLQSF